MADRWWMFLLSWSQSWCRGNNCGPYRKRKHRTRAECEPGRDRWYSKIAPLMILLSLKASIDVWTTATNQHLFHKLCNSNSDLGLTSFQNSPKRTCCWRSKIKHPLAFVDEVSGQSLPSACYCGIGVTQWNFVVGLSRFRWGKVAKSRVTTKKVRSLGKDQKQKQIAAREGSVGMGQNWEHKKPIRGCLICNNKVRKPKQRIAKQRRNRVQTPNPNAARKSSDNDDP